MLYASCVMAQRKKKALASKAAEDSHDHIEHKARRKNFGNESVMGPRRRSRHLASPRTSLSVGGYLATGLLWCYEKIYCT